MDQLGLGDAYPFETLRAPRKRQAHRTITLSPEVYERLKDYAERLNQSMNQVANRKLDLSIPTAEDEAELDALIAVSNAEQLGGVSGYVN
jgi:hypothetical protein